MQELHITYVLFKQNISFQILPDVLYNPCILIRKIFYKKTNTSQRSALHISTNYLLAFKVHKFYKSLARRIISGVCV